MSRKKHRRSPRPPGPARPARPARAPRAAVAAREAPDGLTVGWMLCVMTAGACEIGALGVRVVLGFAPEAAALAVLGSVLIFAAAIIGAIEIGLLPLVIRWRPPGPPRPIVALAVAVGVLPWLVLLAGRWR